MDIDTIVMMYYNNKQMMLFDDFLELYCANRGTFNSKISKMKTKSDERTKEKLKRLKKFIEMKETEYCLKVLEFLIEEIKKEDYDIIDYFDKYKKYNSIFTRLMLVSKELTPEDNAFIKHFFSPVINRGTGGTSYTCNDNTTYNSLLNSKYYDGIHEYTMEEKAEAVQYMIDHNIPVIGSLFNITCKKLRKDKSR